MAPSWFDSNSTASSSSFTGAIELDYAAVFLSGFAGPIMVCTKEFFSAMCCTAARERKRHQCRSSLLHAPVCTQFWIPGSTEVLCAALGRRGSPSPIIVGNLAASGQCSLFIFLFLCGSRISSRWPALRRRVDVIAMHRRKLVERGSLGLTVSAAAIGVPPTVPLFTMAPSFHMRLLPMLCVVYIFRFVRFSAICAFASLHLQATPSPEKWLVFTQALKLHREIRPAAHHTLASMNSAMSIVLNRTDDTPRQSATAMGVGSEALQSVNATALRIG